VATNKDKLIAAAQKLVEKGQFEKAIKEYLKVVADDDKDVRIWLKIGDLYAKLGKKPEAAETYSKVAQFYSDQGFYLKAVAVYKQILKIEPRLVDVNHKLAELYKQLGLLSDAMQQYEAVAAFYHREGKTREALAALKQIVELDPETVANRIKLAELYSKDGMVREAIDEFSKAAEQLRQAGRVDDFMKVAERLLFHSPDNRPVTKELAGLYIEKGDPRRALPKLQVCFKADPRDTDVLSLLAKAFEALDQRQKSVSVLKELARILGENGDARGRDNTWRKILQLAPGDPDAEAALSNPGRARPPSQPSIDEALASPPPARGTGAARTARPDNSTGGRPVAMSPSGRMRTVDDVDGGRDWVKQPAPTPAQGAPRSAVVDPPTRGFAQDADESTTNSSGGGAEEEIAKILNETDVYIKYNLHAKAIEHLQRAFERNPRHVGAREKLKALYLILGKKDEAVLELYSLVENAEPSKRRRYLREILEIDPRNARAAGELGEKLPSEPESEQLTSGIDEFDSGPVPRADDSAPFVADRYDDLDAPERDPEGTGSEMLDVDDLEELSDDEFDVAEPSLMQPRSSFAAEPAEGEDDELIPVVVEPSRVREFDSEEAAGGAGVEDRFGFDDEAGPPVEDRFGGFDDSGPIAPTESEAHSLDEDVVAVERAPKPVTATKRSARPTPSPGDDEADVHTRFDDSPKFDQAALFGNNEEIDEADLPPMTGLPGVKGTTTKKAPQPLLDEDGEEESITNKPGAKPITRTVQTPAALLQEETSGPAGGGSLEDDLDEADFFTQQSLFEEARGILEALLARHPNHPLVTAKLRDLEAMEQAAVGGGESLPQVIEQPGLSADMSAELPGSVDAAPTVGDPAGTFEMTRKGVIEKGVTAEDFETHYDLGIAYKEMGLLDDAINEFRIVMKDPGREVQCHLMIGLCFLEKGMQTDAIGQFKKGLYVEGITEREALSMYFELGQAYERLNDPREALYYYEKVLKRDQHFRDVQKRIDALRGGAPVPQAIPEARNDDVDAAFDTLLGKDI
jgi:tetratricopeptide (TPR) repeat protein